MLSSLYKMVAVCVSAEPKTFPGQIPFINHVDPTPAPARRTIARVRFVSKQRNMAVSKALAEHPNLSHILMVDSWYLDNPQNNQEWDRFIKSYNDPETILGASTYQRFDTRLFEPPMTFFVEIATILEAADSTMNVEGKIGRIRVQAVGSVYIFPIQAWHKHPYQERPDYFHPEHIDLCRESGMPVYLSFDHRFYKPPIRHSLPKKLRVTAGYLRRKYVYA